MQLSIVVLGLERNRQDIVRCVRSAAAGHAVLSANTVEELGAQAPTARLIFASARHVVPTLEVLKAKQSKARVMLLADAVETHVLKLALASARIVGLAASETGVPPNWEISYITRRILAPADPAPVVADFLPWGATNISWKPRTTAALRRIVQQIEGVARNLGCERREAVTVSTAAHELLMNAMYDAPVDNLGKPKYALDRKRELDLPEEEGPEFRLSMSSDYVGLDVSDPFGRLPRNRFFEGVLRGHMNMVGEQAPVLDTSHGGAGLGLHTLYTSGSVLRAELRPLRQTHVSWMLARRSANVSRTARSLYFTPLMDRR